MSRLPEHLSFQWVVISVSLAVDGGHDLRAISRSRNRVDVKMEVGNHQPQLQNHGPIRLRGVEECLLDPMIGGHELAELGRRKVGQIFHVPLPHHDCVTENAPVFMKKREDPLVLEQQILGAVSGRFELATEQAFHQKRLADERKPPRGVQLAAVDVADDV